MMDYMDIHQNLVNQTNDHITSIIFQYTGVIWREPLDVREERRLKAEKRMERERCASFWKNLGFKVEEWGEMDLENEEVYNVQIEERIAYLKSIGHRAHWDEEEQQYYVEYPTLPGWGRWIT